MEMTQNDNLYLDKAFDPSLFPKQGWIEQDTAILVAHGIGRQRPLETIDMFTRPLLQALFEYGEHDEKDFTVTHLLKRKPSDSGGVWFDNIIRIRKAGSDHHLDIYEYYWANQVGERVSFDDIKKWARRTAREAAKFYAQQREFGEKFGDSSPFFSKGKFNMQAYYTFLVVAGVLVPRIDAILDTLGRWCGKIPYVGSIIERGIGGLRDMVLGAFEDYVADVVAYNTDDPNSRHYVIRRNILNGAVRAMRYLIELQNENDSRAYGGILIAAHSLGTEITFDALNRINHLATQGELHGVDTKGRLTLKGDARGAAMDKLLLGFVTFGCPLDKIAFFFRDHSGENAYLRAQMLRHFHSFKQRDWKPADEKDRVELQSEIPRLFDDVPWRNYYDRHDPVSGRLDYYATLTNLDCDFIKGESPTGHNAWNVLAMLRNFTHSRYWDHLPMYGDFLSQMVLKDPAAKKAAPARKPASKKE
jgi:hypothetical protein